MKDYEKLKNIPTELKTKCVWCCWKLTEKGKVPYNPILNQYVKSNKKETFSNYESLLFYTKYYDGVGIGVFDGYSAIDIDDCVKDGVISEMATDIINHCNSYTEFSPSGEGIRIIFKTHTLLNKDKYYIKNSKRGLEIYLSDQTNKFVSMTGNTLNINNEISEVDIQYILDKYMTRYNDLETAISKDAKLNELWNKVAPGSGADESESDLALCDKLAFYLKGDYVAIEDAFMKSPYFLSKDEKHKKKWMNGDYRKNCINKAIQSVTVNTVAIKKSNYTLTDTGNAHRFVDMFKGDCFYNVDDKMWMIWNDKYWEYDYLDTIRDRVELIAEQVKMEIFNTDDENQRKLLSQNYRHILNSSGKDNLLKEARSMKDMAVLNSQFDTQSELLCCENGVVDLRTGKLLPFNKELMMSKSTHINVDFSKEPTLFIKTLSEMFNNDKELLNYVQKLFGMACSDEVREQEMYIFYGDGSNGKSMVLEVVSDILGDYAVQSSPTLLTENFGSANQNLGQIARLKGKRFVCVEELDPDEKAKESVIKSLTSGFGNIIGKKLYANEFQFAFKGKIFMPTNYLLKVKGIDKGIWRRLKVVPITKAFEEQNKDKYLKEKIMLEKEAILGWLIKGYIKYINEGLIVPMAVKNAIEEYKEEQDIVLEWINDMCDTSDKYVMTKASELYQNFIYWCNKNNIRYPLSNNLFGRNLKTKYSRKQLSNCKVYVGIKIDSNKRISDKDIEWERIKVNEEI